MRELLFEGSARLGLTLSEEQVSLFITFHNELKKWGKKMNITALIKNENRLAEELFLDSLSPLKIILPLINTDDANENHILDIGSGGGFPGIPLKIAAPSLLITLSDSKEKKIFFLKHVFRALHLKEIGAVNVTYGMDGARGLEKNKYRWAISKAVSDIQTLGLWARPHLVKGGHLICMKALKEPQIPIEGFKYGKEYTYSLPFSGMKRRLILYEKV